MIGRRLTQEFSCAYHIKSVAIGIIILWCLLCASTCSGHLFGHAVAAMLTLLLQRGRGDFVSRHTW
jgi:hypothetical protein